MAQSSCSSQLTCIGIGKALAKDGIPCSFLLAGSIAEPGNYLEG